MDRMTERERRMVEASRDALRWFGNRLGGTACNGANDDLHIARRLADISALYQDVPVTRDLSNALHIIEAEAERKPR